MLLSICIPTYNRACTLNECLHSLFEQKLDFSKVEVCVSDNGSTDETTQVISKWSNKLHLIVNRNSQNQGIPCNFLKVVSLAKGKYIWLLGDDDIVVPESVTYLLKLIYSKKKVDFFLFNSWNLMNRGRLLPDFSLTDSNEEKRFWSGNFQGEMPFYKIIELNITFDHLGGMYLSIFNRQIWCNAANALDHLAIKSKKTFDTHDNTFPHVKIFAKGFMNKTAYVENKCISYAFSDVREWQPFYPLVRSVRLLESLDEYKKNGLGKRTYRKLRSKSLIFFAEDLLKLILMQKRFKGIEYVSVYRLLWINVTYFGFWLSLINLFVKMVKKIIKITIGFKNDK